MPSHLDNYEFVEDRLKRWWAAYPEAQIITTMMHYDGNTVVFRAEGIVDGKVIATGHAEEVLGSSPVNKTSFVENCETSAIGRLIGNSPLGTKPGARASRQEMEKVERVQSAGTKRLATKGQIDFVKKLGERKKMDDLTMLEAIHELLNDKAVVVETLTFDQAQIIIEAWKR